MTHCIGINCDRGESFGKHEKGRDEEVMSYVTMANVAAGFHGGDPPVMQKTVALADKHDMSVGVRRGLPDLLGFGRRKLNATPREDREHMTYQLGALWHSPTSTASNSDT